MQQAVRQYPVRALERRTSDDEIRQTNGERKEKHSSEDKRTFPLVAPRQHRKYCSCGFRRRYNAPMTVFKVARPLEWSARDRRLFVEALHAAIVVEVGFWTLPFARMLQTSAVLRHRRMRTDSLVSAAEVRRAIRRAYQALPIVSTCLRESLVFCRMFRRRGLSAELHMGVKKANDGLAAHAWVESADGTVLTDALEDFAPICLPGQSLSSRYAAQQRLSR